MDASAWLPGLDAYSNHLYRIMGAPEDFQRADIPSYPQFIFDVGGWFQMEITIRTAGE